MGWIVSRKARAATCAALAVLAVLAAASGQAGAVHEANLKCPLVSGTYTVPSLQFQATRTGHWRSALETVDATTTDKGSGPLASDRRAQRNGPAIAQGSYYCGTSSFSVALGANSGEPQSFDLTGQWTKTIPGDPESDQPAMTSSGSCSGHRAVAGTLGQTGYELTADGSHRGKKLRLVVHVTLAGTGLPCQDAFFSDTALCCKGLQLVGSATIPAAAIRHDRSFTFNASGTTTWSGKWTDVDDPSATQQLTFQWSATVRMRRAGCSTEHRNFRATRGC